MNVEQNSIGIEFADFLAEEEIFEEVEAVTIKRGLAFQIHKLMESQSLSKTARWTAG